MSAAAENNQVAKPPTLPTPEGAPPAFDPETAENNEEIEMQFAVQTVQHLEAYEKILSSIPPSRIKFTPIDDDIYADLLEVFPEFKDGNKTLVNIDEDAMKSPSGKERWRKFIMPYEKKVEDYNFGTLVRRASEEAYAEDNAILVTRIQFFGIEIARNRQGLNDKFYQAQQAQKASA